MPTYNLSFYNISANNVFSNRTGNLSTYNGPATATGVAVVTDNGAGADNLTLEDSNSGENATASITLNNITTNNISVDANRAWTVRDTVTGETFQVIEFRIDSGTHAGTYTLSERPLIVGRSYETLDYTRTPDAGTGDPVFSYADYVGPIVRNGTVSGTSGNDLIDRNYLLDPEGDRVTPGNDTIFAGAGNDTVIASTGNDSISGGDGNDTIYGDNATVEVGPRESLNWTQQGANGTNIANGFTQDTGGMNVTVGFVNNGGNGAVETATQAQYIQPIDGIANNSALFLQGNGGPNATTSITFNAKSGSGLTNSVSNVRFRLNDVDINATQWVDVITVNAFSNNIPVTVTLTAEGDDIVNATKQTVTGAGSGTDNADMANGSVLVTIAGPIDRIEIVYANSVTSGNQFLWVTDVHFDTTIQGDGNDNIDAGTGNDVVYGGGGNDVIQGGSGTDSIYGGAGNDIITDSGAETDFIYGGDGNDTINAGAGNDTVQGGNGEDSLSGDAGDDSIDGGAGNDSISGGADDDILNGGLGNDTIDGGTGNDRLLGEDGNDVLTGGTGNDTLFGGIGNDTLDGGAGNDTLQGDAGSDGVIGGTGSDRIILQNGFGTDDIRGSEDVGNTDIDILDGSALTTAATVVMAGPEAGTLTTSGNTATFIEIEQIVTGSGADSITGSTGADTITSGAGADRINAGAGNDTINLGAGTATDGAADVVVLQDGSGSDIIRGFDGATPATGGTFTGIDKLDVTALFDRPASNPARQPVNTHDVTVTNDGSGNAVLTFPNGENITLIGISPTVANNPYFLNAIGIPLPDGTVFGTTGNDLINGIYNDDNDGDKVDGNDAILAGAAANDDLILAGAGNDTVFAAFGDDSVSGGDGNDTLFGGDGNDTLSGDAGNDTLFGDAGNDTLFGGTGNDTLNGDAGNDSILGGAGSDRIELSNGFGTDNLRGNEDAGSTDTDVLDATGLTGGSTVVMTGNESGTLTSGANVVTFAEIEKIALGAGNDTVTGNANSQTINLGAGADTIAPGGGNDDIDLGNGAADGDADLVVLVNGTYNTTLRNIDAPTALGNGYFTGTDKLDVSGLLDNFGNPVNTQDVVVTSKANGDAVLTFPLGEQVTLVGISATAASNPHYLNALGIPISDGTVSGTSGDDLIDGEYDDDPDGDFVDADDAIILTDIGNDDLIIAGAGNDSILAGDGQDEIYGGADNDTIDGGAGNDTLFGDAGNDVLIDSAGNDTFYGGTGNDTFVVNDFLDTETITGGENTGDNDVLDFSGNPTTGVRINFSGDEAGAFGAENVSFPNNTFSQIETYIGTDFRDTINARYDTTGVTILSGAGDDDITGGTGDDSIAAGTGKDFIIIRNDFGNDVIDGGDGGGDGGEGVGLAGDQINATSLTQDVTLTFTGAESGAINNGTDTLTFSEIEFVSLGSGNDTLISNAESHILFAGLGADTIIAGDGNDTVYLGGFNGDGAADVVVLTNGTYTTRLIDIDLPVSAGGGLYNGTDTLDVSALLGTDGIPVNTNDVSVSPYGFDAVLLTFPEGEQVILEGVTYTDAINPFYLNALGIPLPDGTVSGTTGDDLIDADYTGDTDGDVVDGNDAILPGDTGNDDLIEAGAGKDTILAGSGIDEIYAGSGNDIINGGAGNDTIFGESGDDTILFGNSFGNDSIDGGADGQITGDILYGADLTQDVTLTLTGAESGTISNGAQTLTFAEIEQIGLGSGDDTIIGTADGHTISAGLGADTIAMGDGNDVVDLGNGSADGNADVVVLTNGTYNTTLMNIDTPLPNGDGTFTGIDTLDVTALLVGAGDPVNTSDVTVTDDGAGNAVLTFPLGEMVTLMGITPAEAENPFYLNALGVPLDMADGVVSGTDGDDLIDASYLGDPDGDLVDGDDARIMGEAANDDIIVAGAGNDTVIAGAGNDDIYGGDSNDSISGGDGNDTIYGDTPAGPWFFEYYDLDPAATPDSLAAAGFNTATAKNSAIPDAVGYTDTIDPAAIDPTDGFALKFTTTLTVTTAGNYVFSTISDDGSRMYIDGVEVVQNDSSHTAATQNSGNVALTAGTHTIEIIYFENNANNVLSATISGPDTGGTSANLANYAGLLAPSGDDILNGNDGNDTLFGGAGNDTLSGDDGDDVLYGGDGNDVLIAGNNTGVGDQLFGGAGDDNLTDSYWNATLDGGDDQDTINAGFGNASIIGGEGGTDYDTLSFALANDAVDVTLSGSEDGAYTDSDGDSGTFIEIERFVLTDGEDNFDGSAATAGLTVESGAGNDTIIGGSGGDTITAGTGNDTIFFGEGDTVAGNDGDDTFDLTDTLPGTAGGTISIDGGSGVEATGDTLRINGLVNLNIILASRVDDGTGSYSGTVTLNDGTILNYSKIENIICFTPGTKIATPHGARDIATLKVGDLVVTRDHGLQPIRWIQQRTVPATGRFAPIRIRPGVVTGQENDLIVSPQHRMLFQGYRADLLFGTSEVLIAAAHLVDGVNVTQDEGSDVSYIHMMFDEHEVVYAEGAATESFHPGEIGLSAVSDPARDELFALFPHLRSDVKSYGAAARRSLKRHEAELVRNS